MSAPTDVQPAAIGGEQKEPIKVFGMTFTRGPRTAKAPKGRTTGPVQTVATSSVPAPVVTGGAGSMSRAARAAGAAGGGDAKGKGAKAAKGKAAQLVLVGREPRVDLLPNEVHVDRRERAVVRRAWLGVVVVAAIVVLAIAGATVNSARSMTQLGVAQASTQNLLLQQQKYAEVRSVERDTALAQAAQQVGGSTEVDWQGYISKVEAALPSGVTIASLSIDSASPISAYVQSTIPLEGTRVATLTIGVTSTTLPSVPALSDALSGLPGYVDSTISQVSQDTATGGYAASFVMHIDAKAFDGKYTTTEK